MPLTTNYGIKTDYQTTSPVSARDLNLRGMLFNTQMPGVLVSVGQGVVDVDETALDSLQVVALDGIAQITQGAATILSAGDNGTTPHLVFGSFSGGTIDWPSGQPYIHATLKIGELPNDPTDTSEGTSELVIECSEDEEVPGGLLLAEWNGTSVIDRRTFTFIGQTRRLLGDQQSQINELAVRIESLEGPAGGDPESGVTVAQFNALRNRVDELETALANGLADLSAQISALKGGFNLMPFPMNQLASEVAMVKADIAEINPSAVERGQISVVVGTAGHAQNDTPDFTPDTGDPREIPYDSDEGTFG